MTIGQVIFAFSSFLSASVAICLDHLDLHLPPCHHGLAAGQEGHSSLSPSSPWTSSSPSSSSSSSSPWSCSRAGGAQLAQWGSCRLHYYLALTHTHTNLPTYLYPFQNTLKDAHSNIYSGKIITVLIKRCAFLALVMFI